jgi:hypothetical protein
VRYHPAVALTRQYYPSKNPVSTSATAFLKAPVKLLFQTQYSEHHQQYFRSPRLLFISAALYFLKNTDLQLLSVSSG